MLPAGGQRHTQRRLDMGHAIFQRPNKIEVGDFPKI
jgi:hypothetical protein